MRTALVMQAAPNKPKWGEPCNGCGFCCASEVCEVGKEIHGDAQPAPCPSMQFHEGRFLCGAVAMADEIGPLYGLALRIKMGIGIGCDSFDDPVEVKRAAKIMEAMTCPATE